MESCGLTRDVVYNKILTKSGVRPETEVGTKHERHRRRSSGGRGGDKHLDTDLEWNLYLQSSTGTISVSRMYLAPGSDPSVHQYFFTLIGFVLTVKRKSNIFMNFA